MQLNFPEDYDESQERCKEIAHQLAQRHANENILLVCQTIPYCKHQELKEL